MRLTLLFLFVAFIGFAHSRGVAQASTPDSTSTTPSRPAHARPSHPTPCWRQAGLTSDLVNRRWKIEDQAKTKIQAACTEETTSAKQKHDKIEQIHQETDQAIAKLIPAKQLAAFNACQAELDKNKPKPAKELGPCGGAIPKTDSAMPGMDHTGHH